MLETSSDFDTACLDTICPDTACTDTARLDTVCLDLQRGQRLGLPEAIFCLNKTPDQIETIIDAGIAASSSHLFTRLTDAKYHQLSETYRAFLDYHPHSETAVLGSGTPLGQETMVSVICAGTSDLKVSGEVQRTLNFHGLRSLVISDVGVAGIHRLLSRIDEVKDLPVHIVIAGMDAAIATVFGGLVSGLIIAVPTSTGYGVANQGEAALHAMLASCSPGIPVMNIDNGYGAACAAIRAMGAFKQFRCIQTI